MKARTNLSHLASILTDRQRLYVTLRYHDCIRPIAIAQRFNVTKRSVNYVLANAMRALKKAGITPPAERVAGLKQKGNSPQVRTVDPFVLGEMVEG